MTFFEQYYRHERYFAILDRLATGRWQWIALSAMVVVIDFLTGPIIQFPLFFIVPIALAAWSERKKQALLLAVFLPFTRFTFNVLLWHVPWGLFDTLVNMLIRVALFFGLVYLVSQAKELRILKGVLHICSYCGRVREDDQWISLQEYIANHSEALLSHGICPSCLPKLTGTG